MADNNSLVFADLIAEYDFVVDDLSVWEIINPSSSEASDDDFSVAADEEEEEAVAEDSVADEIQVEEAPLDVGSPSSDVSMEDSLPAPAKVNQLDSNGDGDGDVDYSAMIATIDAAVDAFNGRYGVSGGPSVTINGFDYDGGVGGYDEEYEEEHDSYDDEYEYGDKLFPYSSSNKFGRQRAKKSGKKVVQKVKKGAKKMPCRYSKRCVYGKDGLGAQHSYL